MKNLRAWLIGMGFCLSWSLTAQINELTNSLGMKLRLIPAGEFLMGSPAADGEAHADEFPQHRVLLSRPFFIGAHEVTRGQFAAYLAASGRVTEAEQNGKGAYGPNPEGKFVRDRKFTWKTPGFPQTDDHPVVGVSWNDAVTFCRWLSEQEGRTYRLPTEAEWEFACRAGSSSKYEYGDDPEELSRVSNIADELLQKKYSDRPAIASRDGYVFTSPVGQFRPNAFGLYDLHGNVGEWCQDIYDPKAYLERAGTTVDPLVLTGGRDRVGRGGCWYYTARFCRSAKRNRDAQADGTPHRGFRVVLIAPNP